MPGRAGYHRLHYLMRKSSIGKRKAEVGAKRKTKRKRKEKKNQGEKQHPTRSDVQLRQAEDQHGSENLDVDINMGEGFNSQSTSHHGRANSSIENAGGSGRNDGPDLDNNSSNESTHDDEGELHNENDQEVGDNLQDSKTIFNVTDDELQEIIDAWVQEETRCDVSKSLDDSLAVYYLNSGYKRFQEHLKYSQQHDGKPINLDKIKNEILEEKLSNKELFERVKSYFKAHDFEARLLSCGACGIRLYESDNTSASIKYTRRSIESLPDIYKYSASQLNNLNAMKSEGALEVPSAPSANGERTTTKIEPWKMVSYFQSRQTGTLYHLHPELVDRDPNGIEFTYLCPRCQKASKKTDGSPKCYKLSIAAGVDFGNLHRIEGLIAPNLHEQLILSKYRLYSCIIKIIPNGRGFQQMHSMHKMRGNQILFAHDSVHCVTHSMATWTEEDIHDMIEVHFYDESGQNDGMARAAYGTNQLYARPHVLSQWFAVLSRTNLNYADVKKDTVDQLIINVTKAVQEKKNNPIFTSDKESLNHEKNLGSDVAGAQQVDGMTTSYNEMLVDSAHMDEVFASPTPPALDRTMPMRTHYVAQCPETLMEKSDIRKNLEAFNLRKLAEKDCMDDPRSHINGTSTIADILSSENIAFLEDLIGCSPSTKSHGRIIYSGRSCHPANELDPNDKLLTSTFPWIFPLGRCYGRATGNLSQEQLTHLLFQFHQVPSQDRRLLGYLADVQRRFEVIDSVRFRLSGNDRVIEKINEFLERDDHDHILSLLKNDPDNKKIKDLWKDLKPILELIGGNVMYGALEGSRCLSRTFETAKRYGHGCCFLTFSVDDNNNSRGMRAAMKTISNEKFPASFGAPGEVTSLEDLLENIRELSTLVGQGVIPFDESRPWLNLHRSNLCKLASENPVAYVMETKSILHHVLTILFGLPPEGFFGAYEGQSTRKTKYYKLRSNGKGIFGHVLAYIGVVEDHAKGTLHFHIIFFGSISSYVLHDLSCVPDICKTISEVLDSFYKAKYSTMTNARNAVTRTLNKSSNIALAGEKLSPPPLLQRTDPINQIESIEEPGTCCMDTLEKLTSNERVMLCFHEHHRTCRKGFHGRTRCRLAKKSGISQGTKCVLLEPLSLERNDGEGTSIEHHHEIGSEVNDNPTVSTVTQSTSTTGEQEKDQKPLFSIKQVPTDCQPTYRLKSPLRRTEEEVIVWELDRPTPDIKEVPGLQHFELDALHAPLLAENMGNIRSMISSMLQKLLRHETGTVGYLYRLSGSSSKSALWDFLDNGDIVKVRALYEKIVAAIKTGNQYAVEHSIPLFYCTGSHNNTALLGGCEQARSAMFYIAPYMSKEKAPLSVCLTALEKARKDIAKYPSKANDLNSKRRERTTKHFVSRVVNKLHAYNELSDYQVAAYLINLPSLITSEQFQWSETSGAINYQKNLRAKIEDPNCQGEDIDAYLGHYKTYTVEKAQNDGDDDVRRASPVVSCYFHRGRDLKNLSLSEYDALIQVKEKPKEGTETRSKAYQFANDQDFYLCARYHQVLRAKQRTLIFKGKQPPFPGKEPPAGCKTYKTWKAKADRYAEYLLTMYRPSEIYNGMNHHPDTLQQGFRWRDLVQWVEEQQCAKSVVSKFRLMAIERRMHCLSSDYNKKRMLSEYRAREADVWSDRTKLRIQKEQEREQWYHINHDFRHLEECQFENAHTSLTTAQSDTAYIINGDSVALEDSFRDAFNLWEQGAEFDKQGNFSTWNVSQQTMFEVVDDSDDWHAKSDWVANDHGADSILPFIPRNTVDGNTGIASQTTASTPTADKKLPNSKQSTIIEQYKGFLTDPTVAHREEPPPVILLTGGGGTGKSFVIHELLEIGNSDCETHVWTSANNNLNAADVDGCTIASLLKHPIKKKNTNEEDAEDETKIPIKPISPAAIANLHDSQVSNTRLLIIDEISNVTAQKLGQLSRLFSAALQSDSLFGGLKLLLVGDFNQKEPIGELATKTLLKHTENFKRLQKVSLAKPQNLSKPAMSQKIQKKDAPKAESLFSKTQHSCVSDATLGCQILAEAKWFELTDPERSKDGRHNAFLHEMYTNGTALDPSMFAQNYKLFDNATLSQDSPDELEFWLRAPAIVKTNVERIRLNFLRAFIFAKHHKTFLFRWLAKPSRWEGKPATEEAMEETLKDPAFWEIFVSDAPCYLDYTVSKKKKLCNGTRGTYHSLTLSDEGLREFHAQALSGQTVITLTEPPTGINVLIDDEMVTHNPWVDWNGLEYTSPTTHKKTIKVPIKPANKNVLDNPVYIVPKNILIRPSRVQITYSFPIRPGFAITVDKAQGQTMDRVIVCLSEREKSITNFTYACVYVAMSRVREAKHCRILLKKAPNPKLQWDTLLYLTKLKKQPSIDAFFAGFRQNRKNWKNDKWNPNSAYSSYKRNRPTQ